MGRTLLRPETGAVGTVAFGGAGKMRPRRAGAPAWTPALRGFVTVRAGRQGGVYYLVSSMFGSLGYLIDESFVGTGVALACVAVGSLVWRRAWNRREQRRAYRERGRQRQQYWGWE
jgi:hypothetical protein